MKTTNEISNFKPIKKTVVTIGTFDGVHLGHRKILQKVIQSAKELNCESVVLTFFPHPQIFLNENSDIKMLNTMEEKIKNLDSLGLDNLIIHPFDKEFSSLSAEEFVKEFLVEKLNVKKIIIGYDHRFGKNRSANFDDLVVLAKKYNFDVEQITAEELNEIAISSTKIRNAILTNNFKLAEEYLNYQYFFSGVVTKGKQLGGTLDFPTANLILAEKYKLLPKNGVYIVNCWYNNILFEAMMNIGNRPTVNGTNQTIEVHIFDFDEDIYNKTLKIIPLKFLREEKKFNSLTELKNQLSIDKFDALSFFKNKL